MTEREIDCWKVEEITCPWCGWQVDYSAEYPDAGKVDCEECGRSFKYQREIDVDYTSEKL